MSENHQLNIEKLEKEQNIFLKWVNLCVSLFCKPDVGPRVDTWTPIPNSDSQKPSENTEEHNHSSN